METNVSMWTGTLIRLPILSGCMGASLLDFARENLCRDCLLGFHRILGRAGKEKPSTPETKTKHSLFWEGARARKMRPYLASYQRAQAIG